LAIAAGPRANFKLSPDEASLLRNFSAALQREEEASPSLAHIMGQYDEEFPGLGGIGLTVVNTRGMCIQHAVREYELID